MYEIFKHNITSNILIHQLSVFYNLKTFIILIDTFIYTIWTSLCSSKLKPRCHYGHNYWYKRRQKAVCCSLLISTSSMGGSGELSDFERGLVVGCHTSKKSVRGTATLLKLPKSTAGDVIVKWKYEGLTTMKPRLDRPCLMTNRDHLVLKKVVRETHQTSNETTTHEFFSAPNCPASTKTLRRESRGMGIHG
jgi:hypothetical protein